MDEKIMAYKVELQKQSENTPFWTKKILTVKEAAEYTGTGRAKIRQIITQENCPFTVNNGTQICVIREAFIDYLDKQLRILAAIHEDIPLQQECTKRGVNVKVIQDTLGHKDILTTLNIYTDVTKRAEAVRI